MELKPLLKTLILGVVALLSPVVQAIAIGNSSGQSTSQRSESGTAPSLPQALSVRRTVDLSGTWEMLGANGTSTDVTIPSSQEYEGERTFRRKFQVNEEMLAQSAVQFVALGVNFNAEVYVNDVFVGKHTGGYTTFEIDIPEDVLQLGPENVLSIVTSSSLDPRNTIPLKQQIWGWKSYAGIIREAYLRLTPRLWIRNVKIQTTFGERYDQASIAVTAVLRHSDARGTDSLAGRSQTASYEFVAELIDPGNGQVVQQASSGNLQMVPLQDTEAAVSLVVRSPRLWSPEQPSLYTLRTRLVRREGRVISLLDERTRSLGLTDVDISGDKILVNGRSFMLKGVVWHEEWPATGVTSTPGQLRADVEAIKSLGANAVRVAFHPPHPEFIELCNQLGLFVMEQIPVRMAPGAVVDDGSFQILAEEYAREMVDRDQNEVSVLAWGVGDLLDTSDPRTASYVERIAASIRSIDTRPLYYGSAFRGEDLCAELVELPSFSMTGIERGAFQEELELWKRHHEGKPPVIFGYGAVVESGNRNGYSDPRSEESQARFYVLTHAIFRQTNLAGVFIDSYSDWFGERPVLTNGPDQPYVHPLGLVDAAREKRLAFDVVRNLYAGQRTTALPIGSYREPFPVIHIVGGFLVIFILAYQYHYNRRFNETFKRALLRSYNFFADLRDLRSVSPFHTAMLGVVIALTLGLITSSIIYHFKTSLTADFLLSVFLFSDSIKEYVIYLAWNPLIGVGVLSAAYVVPILLLSFPVRLIAMILRVRVLWFHAFTVIVWGAAPIVFLSPVAMSIFKLFSNPVYVLPVFILLGIVGIWVVMRILKGISVIYDASAVKTYIAGVLVIGGFLAALFVYLDVEFALSAYLDYLNHLPGGLG